MEPKFWVGLLAVLGLFLFLIRKNRKKIETLTPAQQWRTILNRTLLQSKYANLARYWFWISAFETGNFTSNLFKSANNPWGMMMPNKRKTTASGQFLSSRPWARYNSLEDAAKDIILYMDEFNYPTASPSFFSFVQTMKAKGYFEEPFDVYYSRAEANRKRIENLA